MTEKKQRRSARTTAATFEVVTVYRDRKGLPYDDAVKMLSAHSDLYAIFSVVAVVHDASEGGLGIRIEGQQLMAKNLMRPKERYILKLVVARGAAPKKLARYLVTEGNYSSLLLQVMCRWYRPTEGTSAAGLEILETNASDVLEFVRSYLNTPASR
jgi:hypothetical protein